MSVAGKAQLAPSLSPSLTENAVSTPVTTLSPDLLTPQRTFTYDGTGASIFANALDPEISASVPASPAETDTAIRDSSQAGQISPYIQSAGRLGLSFSGDWEAAETAFTASENARTGDVAGYGSGTSPGTGADFDRDGYAPKANNAFDSSWGVSAPVGWRSMASVWNGKAANVDRMGLSESSAFGPASAGAEYRPGDYQLGDAQSGDSRGNLREDSLAGSRFSGRNLAFGSTAVLGEGPSGTSRTVAASYGVGSIRSPGVGRARAIPGYSSSGMSIEDRSALSGAAQAPMSGAPQSHDDMFLFSPRSYAGYSFGSSPFSPPRSGDLTFLHPDILAVTLPPYSRRGNRGRQTPLRSLGGNGELAPSLSSPDLNDQPLPDALQPSGFETGQQLEGTTLPGVDLASPR